MVVNNMLAYSEIDVILDLLEDDYKQKVPKTIRNFFKEEKMDGYNPKIDVDIPLTEQNLKRETMVLLSILNINYWCESQEEKQKFLNELTENEKEKKKLEESYNPENLFKNITNNAELNEEPKKENTEIIIYNKTNFLTKLLNKIKQLLKKR